MRWQGEMTRGMDLSWPRQQTLRGIRIPRHGLFHMVQDVWPKWAKYKITKMWSRVYYIYIHIIWGFYQEHWVNTGEIADTYTDIYISWNNLIYPLYQAAHINYSDINSYWLIFNFIWINYHIYSYINLLCPNSWYHSL